MQKHTAHNLDLLRCAVRKPGFMMLVVLLLYQRFIAVECRGEMIIKSFFYTLYTSIVVHAYYIKRQRG